MGYNKIDSDFWTNCRLGVTWKTFSFKPSKSLIHFKNSKLSFWLELKILNSI